MRYCICLLRNHISTVPCQQQCRRCPHWPRWPLRRLSHCLCLPSTQHRCLSSSSSWVLHSHRKVPNAQLQLDLSPRSPLSNSLPSFRVQYLPENKVLNRETTAQFKQVSLRLLDRMSCKEGYITIVTMLEDIADALILWIADILVGSIDTDCNDKLGWSSSPHHPALLDTPTCFSLASDIFLKEASISDVSKKIASAIDESLFKQREEFFRVNSSQSFNMNYQPPEEVLVIQLHIIPPITVPRVNSLRAWSR